MENQTASFIDALPASKADWDGVPMVRRTPMQHFIWMRACVETLHKNDRNQLFAVGEDNDYRGLAVFAQRGIFPARLFLVGAEELGEPVDMVCADRAAAEAIAKQLLRARKPLRLGHFPADAMLVEQLENLVGKSGFLLSAPVSGSPYIELDETWIHPETHFTSRRRSDLRRMERKARALGEIGFEILSPTPDAASELLDRAIGVEAQSWKSRSKTALADNEGQAAFFRRYAELASQEGVLRICFMKIDGALAAMQIAVECDNAFWLFKIGYDERYAKCSPGNLLMLNVVRYAAEKGLASFEFLGKSAPWTKLWTECERENIRLRYYPASITGCFALGVDAVEIALRRMKDRLLRRPRETEG